MNTNTCPRCGKERIVIKKWVEKQVVGEHTSKITHIMTRCPDKSCQLLVDKDIAMQRQRDKERKEEKEAKEKVQIEERAEKARIAQKNSKKVEKKPKTKKKKRK